MADQVIESSSDSTKSTRKYFFQPGNKYAKGGKRKGAGRKSQRQLAINHEVQVTAREYVRQHLEGNVGKLMATYIRLATSGKDSTTTRHAIDKIDPDEVSTVQPSTIQFIQYNVTIDKDSAITIPVSSPASSSPASSPVSPAAFIKDQSSK